MPLPASGVEQGGRSLATAAATTRRTDTVLEVEPSSVSADDRQIALRTRCVWPLVELGEPMPTLFNVPRDGRGGELSATLAVDREARKGVLYLRRICAPCFMAASTGHHVKAPRDIISLSLGDRALNGSAPLRSGGAAKSPLLYTMERRLGKFTDPVGPFTKDVRKAPEAEVDRHRIAAVSGSAELKWSLRQVG